MHRRFILVTHPFHFTHSRSQRESRTLCRFTLNTACTPHVAAIIGRRVKQKANEAVLLKVNFFQIQNHHSGFFNLASCSLSSFARLMLFDVLVAS